MAAQQLTSRIGFEVVIENQAWLDANLMSGDLQIITAYIVSESKDHQTLWLCLETHLQQIIREHQFEENLTPDIKKALGQLSVAVRNNDPNIVSVNPEWFPELDEIKEFMRQEELYEVELESAVNCSI